VLQCVAVCCSVLQYVVFINVTHLHVHVRYVLQGVAVCASVWQCGAVCRIDKRSTLHTCVGAICVAVCCMKKRNTYYTCVGTICAAVCCSVLQCVAVWCSVLY